MAVAPQRYQAAAVAWSGAGFPARNSSSTRGLSLEATRSNASVNAGWRRYSSLALGMSAA